jgi:hypothetical protein
MSVAVIFSLRLTVESGSRGAGPLRVKFFLKFVECGANLIERRPGACLGLNLEDER